MSNIPKNRKHLITLIETHFEKLWSELEDIDARSSKWMCDDEFSIKEILAVRIWWSKAVVKWIQTGKKDQIPDLPAKGYTWRETPQLNLATAKDSRNSPYETIKKSILMAKKAVLQTVEGLTENELTQSGVFEWAGKWPLMRWISVSTSTQYEGATKLIRKAKRTNKA